MSRAKRLTRREAAIIKELAAHPGIPVSAWQLAVAAQFPDTEFERYTPGASQPAAVMCTYTHICSIRRKFGHDVIQTVPQEGLTNGYRLAPSSLAQR